MLLHYPTQGDSMATWTDFTALLAQANMSKTAFCLRYMNQRSANKVNRWKDKDDVPRWAIESLQGYIIAKGKHGDAWE